MKTITKKNKLLILILLSTCILIGTSLAVLFTGPAKPVAAATDTYYVTIEVISHSNEGYADCCVDFVSDGTHHEEYISAGEEKNIDFHASYSVFGVLTDDFVGAYVGCTYISNSDEQHLIPALSVGWDDIAEFYDSDDTVYIEFDVWYFCDYADYIEFLTRQGVVGNSGWDAGYNQALDDVEDFLEDYLTDLNNSGLWDNDTHAEGSISQIDDIFYNVAEELYSNGYVRAIEDVKDDIQEMAQNPDEDPATLDTEFELRDHYRNLRNVYTNLGAENGYNSCIDVVANVITNVSGFDLDTDEVTMNNFGEWFEDNLYDLKNTWENSVYENTSNDLSDYLNYLRNDQSGNDLDTETFTWRNPDITDIVHNIAYNSAEIGAEYGYNGGVEKGYKDGYTDGVSDGYNESLADIISYIDYVLEHPADYDTPELAFNFSNQSLRDKFLRLYELGYDHGIADSDGDYNAGYNSGVAYAIREAGLYVDTGGEVYLENGALCDAYDEIYWMGYNLGHTEGYTAGVNAGSASSNEDSYNAGYNSGIAYAIREAALYVDTGGELYLENGALCDAFDEIFDMGHNLGYTEGDTAGYNRGYTEGGTYGREHGYSEGYTAGRTSGESAGRTQLLTELNGYVLQYRENPNMSTLADNSELLFNLATAAFNEGLMASDVVVDDTVSYNRGYRAGLEDGREQGTAIGESNILTEARRLYNLYINNNYNLSVFGQNGDVFHDIAAVCCEVGYQEGYDAGLEAADSEKKPSTTESPSWESDGTNNLKIILPALAGVAIIAILFCGIFFALKKR